MRASRWCCAACLWHTAAFAQPHSVEMAEPLIGESVTDVDGDEPGTVEADAKPTWRRSGDGTMWLTGESAIEIRLTRRLGIEAGVSGSGWRDHGLRGGIDGGVSYAVLHDFARDFHLQLELRAHGDGQLVAPRTSAPPIDDDGAPVDLALRGGWRTRWLTLRFGAGPAIGGSGTPVRADAALYTEWGASGGTASFAGVEAVSDGTNSTPVVIAPELVFGFRASGNRFRIGGGVPVFLGNRVSGTFVGVMASVVIDFDQECN